MADEQDPKGDDRLEEVSEWQRQYEAQDQSPRELFTQVSNVALCMSFDLIDKLRYWEKATLSLSDEEIANRIPHMAGFLDRLKAAYLEFSDVDL